MFYFEQAYCSLTPFSPQFAMAPDTLWFLAIDFVIGKCASLS
jgi:hypothetical protein